MLVLERRGRELAATFTGAPAAVAFLAERFAGGPVVTNCPAGSEKPPAQPTQCDRGRTIALRPRRRSGERIRRLVARERGRVLARRRGRDLRKLRVKGLRPGRHTIRLRIVSNKGKRSKTVRRTVRCAE